MNTAARIKAALHSLTRQPDAEAPWVVIEHGPKFVQFAGSAARPLLLDLPWQPMSEVEFYRAAAYFKKWGVTGAELETFDQHGNRAGTQFTFNMTFRSVDAATRTALDIFAKVYTLPKDCDLAIERSWDP